MESRGNIYIYGISDKNCGVCGKSMIVTPVWLYTLFKGKQKIWYCSYNCYRKAGDDSGRYNRKK